jgi:hypothetical protein
MMKDRVAPHVAEKNRWVEWRRIADRSREPGGDVCLQHLLEAVTSRDESHTSFLIREQAAELLERMKDKNPKLKSSLSADASDRIIVYSGHYTDELKCTPGVLDALLDVLAHSMFTYSSGGVGINGGGGYWNLIGLIEAIGRIGDKRFIKLLCVLATADGRVKETECSATRPGAVAEPVRDALKTIVARVALEPEQVSAILQLPDSLTIDETYLHFYDDDSSTTRGEHRFVDFRMLKSELISIDRINRNDITKS